MSVYGLVYGPTSGGSFPSPYDVRLGVDNGQGQLGTLTSPIPATVLIGTTYGGNGDQYTGTLYVPSSVGGTSWTDDMNEIWHEEAEQEWPCRMQYGAFDFPCVRNPINNGFGMQLAGFNERADTIIDILRTDAQLCGLYGFKQDNPQSKRPIVKSDGISFQVLKMENDSPTQPSVRFFCAKLQANG